MQDFKAWVARELLPIERIAMREPELMMLALLAFGHRTVIEVGALTGSCTKLLCTLCERVYSVDHFVGDRWVGTHDFGYLHDLHTATTKEFQRGGQLTVLAMDTATGAAQLRRDGVTADLIFIDAAHDTEHVRADITNYLPLLAPGGVMCGHDPTMEGVKAAVNELLPGALLYETNYWAWREGLPDLEVQA